MTLWRRRLLIGAAILAFLPLVFGVEVVYDNARLSRAPNAWFIVYTSTARSSYTSYGDPESVISDGYLSQRQCEDALAKLTGYGPVGCQRLLLSDAAKMRARLSIP